MDTDTILTLANRAAASVYARWPDVIAWNDADWADCRQAAAEGVVRALRTIPLDAALIPYCARAARDAATRWLWREAIGRSIRAGTFDEWMASGVRAPRARLRLSPDRKRVLWRILSARKRDRWQEAATDMRIIEYLLDGVSIDTIARRLRLTPNALRVRRQRIRERLRRYWQQEASDEGWRLRNVWD